jgi:glycosyltransferase involved in cell wall biosynthesis
MKIVLIAPGIVAIPPPGWGAVEILIWDLKIHLEKTYNADVVIINTPHWWDIIQYTNENKPDIVHIHYDAFWKVIPYIECKNIFITSHYGYLEQKSTWFPRYHEIFKGFLDSGAYIHCLSDGIKQVYEDHGVPKEKLYVIPNGANHHNFVFYDKPAYPDKTIYLGKIEPRKRQYVYQNIPFIHFVGNNADNGFDHSSSNYLREWSKQTLYNNLSNYANLMLLSDGECHPLVVAEALICGLGVVVSEYAAANLDRSLPFVTVIPNDKLNDLEYITTKTKENQEISLNMRTAIRWYGLQKFSWSYITTAYYKMYESVSSPLTA